MDAWWSFGSALKYFLMVRRAFSDKDDGKVGSGGRRSQPTGRLSARSSKTAGQRPSAFGANGAQVSGLRDLTHTWSVSVSKYVWQAR